MEKIEYDNQLKAIEEEAKRKRIALMKEYALSNSDVKVGDIFTDHIGSIRVERINVTGGYSGDYPSCVYFGLVLKKDGTPTKKMEKRNAWQSNKIKS